MTNPFDAATEAMIECYDRNVEYFKTAGYIVYKEHEGLSTFYAKHKRDVPRPNYPVPATLDLPTSLISALWLRPLSRHYRTKVNKWWHALCFDSNGHYIG